MTTKQTITEAVRWFYAGCDELPVGSAHTDKDMNLVITKGDLRFVIGDEYDEDGSYWGATWTLYERDTYCPADEDPWVDFHTDGSQNAEDAITALKRLFNLSDAWDVKPEAVTA